MRSYELAERDTDYFMAMSTALAVRSRTAWYPDGGPPSGCRADLVARVEFSEITTLSRAGECVVGLDMAAFERLLELGEQAIADGGGESGADTAIGRNITTLELELYRMHKNEPPMHAIYSLNHCYPSDDGPASWRKLLVDLRNHCATGSCSTPCEVLDWMIPWFSAAS
jgi:hypothetical protein